MYCSRPVAVRAPAGAVRAARPACRGARNASFLAHPHHQHHQHHPHGRWPGQGWGWGSGFTGGDLAPFFRAFDELTTPFSPQVRNGFASSQPRFDVQEVGDAYELRGELPGVEAEHVEIEFADPQTLVIKGRTEREYTSGTPPQAQAQETQQAQAVTDAAAVETETSTIDNSDAASSYSTGSYQKPSVEDEAAEGQAQATPAESTVAAETPATVAAEAETQQQEAQVPNSRYWISERSTGSFKRVFKFEAKVNQDEVKASLKNGILSIRVPKAAPPVSKKIQIE